MEIAVYSGEKALFFMGQLVHKRHWNNLYRDCSWATVFQDFEWIKAWYELYHSNDEPLLLIGIDRGQVMGIFPLCITQKGKIMGAGKEQAEYHACICVDEHLEEFFTQCLNWMQENKRNFTLQLKYLPPKFPSDFLRNLSLSTLFFYQKKHAVPLIPIDREYFETELNKKNKKEKLRRLRRLGDLKFERIEDFHQLEALMPALIVQHDFRKGAMYGKEYFLEDPLKKDFMLALFKRGLLHVTLLKVNHEIIAVHAGCFGDDVLYLQGFNSHSPTHAKYSPGILQLLLLGKQLSEEGFKFFDLTPGGVSGYKSELATAMGECIELILTPSRKKQQLLYMKDFLKNKSDQWLPKSMHTFGNKDYLSAQKKEKLKIAQNFKKWGWIEFTNRKKRIQEPQLSFQTLKISFEDLQEVETVGFEWNSLEDLLMYQEEDAVLTKGSFLLEAMKRLEYGHEFMSYVTEGSLVSCFWFVPEGSKSMQEGIEKVSKSYCFEMVCQGKKGMNPSFMRGILLDLMKRKQLQFIDIRCGLNENKIIQIKEQEESIKIKELERVH